MKEYCWEVDVTQDYPLVVVADSYDEALAAAINPELQEDLIEWENPIGDQDIYLGAQFDCDSE